MKASIFSAACALILSGAAQGANPFSDVAPSHWSYRSVQRLTEAGVVEGDPGGAFRGERPLTRWEMAQVTARLLAKEDRLTPDERAETARLAEEYAEELASLGVRAAKAEAQAGQITWRGEMRTAYQKWTENKDNGKNHVRTGRLRLMMRGDVNDTTYAAGRLTTGDIDFESGDSGDLSMDRLYVRHAFGPARLTLGRYELDLGVQDRWLYGNAFDGAELAADLTQPRLRARGRRPVPRCGPERVQRDGRPALRGRCPGRRRLRRCGRVLRRRGGGLRPLPPRRGLLPCVVLYERMGAEREVLRVRRARGAPHGRLPRLRRIL